MPELGLADRILVSGDQALASVATAFLENSDLDWPRQVVTLADRPELRQLAGLAAVFTGSSKAGHVLSSTELDAEKPVLDELERLTSSARFDLVVSRGQISPGVRQVLDRLQEQVPTLRFG